MIGQSKLRLINVHIWDQPWFVDLDEKQKLAYFFMHLKCSDIGIYLHSDKAMKNNLGFSYTIPEIVEWLNDKNKMAIELNDSTLLFQRFIRDHSKRGTMIKPVSNPDLGKIREAIDSSVLDELINNGTFHPECKYFEVGIAESIIENAAYSSKRRKGKDHSDYEIMLQEVKGCINHNEGLHKPFVKYIEGLSKPIQNVLIQTSSKGKASKRDQNQIIERSIYLDISDGLSFSCANHFIEDLVKDECEKISAVVQDAEEWMLDQKHEFVSLVGINQRWEDFVSFMDKELQKNVV